MMNQSTKLLSDIVTFTKYARYRSDLGRRETWEEIIDRYIGMMLGKYCGETFKEQWKQKKVDVSNNTLAKEIIEKSSFLYDKKVLPSMRMCQFSGPAVERNHSRGYNCSFLPIDDIRAFSEVMFLLLGGTGVGYSVQYNHVGKLPPIQKPLNSKKRKFLIADSLEGWADSIKTLMKAYFGKTRYKPVFDYSDIRPKGQPLVTAGGKAPGPEPLRICLTKIEALLSEKEEGGQLTPFEAHRICCLIADAVLAGGIRRAALISLFSFDDRQMGTCKYGHWWEKYPELGRANNSAVIVRGRVKKAEFMKFWDLIKGSGSGEPGVYFTNDPSYGSNPCVEISLREFSFCNLTTINAGAVENQEDLDQRARVAAFFGTLQAGFTDFHYLRPEWRNNTEKDALIGVSMTGIASGNVDGLNLQIAADKVKDENARVAEIIGINKAARCTTIKPEGTASLVCGTSSGVHAWYSEYYIRNIQCAVGDDLWHYFIENHPKLIKEMDLQPGSAVIGIPIKAPKNALTRQLDPAAVFLDRVKRFNIDWVREGHRSGPNYNNVSATVNVKSENDELGWKDEWGYVGDWMWRERKNYNGISVLPYDNGTYKDAPFEECSEYQYKVRSKYIEENPINLTEIHEDDDNTNLSGELACAGGKCVIL